MICRSSRWVSSGIKELTKYTNHVNGLSTATAESCMCSRFPRSCTWLTPKLESRFATEVDIFRVSCQHLNWLGSPVGTGVDHIGWIIDTHTHTERTTCVGVCLASGLVHFGKVANELKTQNCSFVCHYVRPLQDCSSATCTVRAALLDWTPKNCWVPLILPYLKPSVRNELKRACTISIDPQWWSS